MCLTTEERQTQGHPRTTSGAEACRGYGSRVNLEPWLFASMLLLCCATRPAWTPDGRITDPEWKNARAAPLGADGSVAFLEDGGTLHVALAGGNDGIASLFLHDGDRVFVLHASAALGTAIFERDSGGHWRNTQDFTWEARQPDDAAAREAFRAKHGWLANVTPPRPGQPPGGDREFLVDLPRFRKSAPLKVAAGYLHLREDGQSVDAWPASVRDAVTSVPLHQGVVTGESVFTPETWHLVGR